MPGRVHPIFRNEFITVTDLPIWAGPAAFAGYNYTPADPRAVQLYQQSGMGLLNADQHLLFWQRLGLAVSINRVARCHGCAAFAARVLHERGFTNAYGRDIWICGRGDHYFLVLSANGGIVEHSNHNAVGIFNPGDIVVDLWLYNVTRQTTGQLNLASMACTVANFPFIAGAVDIHVFVRYH